MFVGAKSRSSSLMGKVISTVSEWRQFLMFKEQYKPLGRLRPISFKKQSKLAKKLHNLYILYNYNNKMVGSQIFQCIYNG